jgi:hypothetical protein
LKEHKGITYLEGAHGNYRSFVRNFVMETFQKITVECKRNPIYLSNSPIPLLSLICENERNYVELL